MTHDARRLCRMPREGGTMLSGTPLWNQLSHIRLRKEEDDYDTVCSHDDEEDDQAEANLTSDWQPLYMTRLVVPVTQARSLCRLQC